MVYSDVETMQHEAPFSDARSSILLTEAPDSFLIYSVLKLLVPFVFLIVSICFSSSITNKLFGKRVIQYWNLLPAYVIHLVWNGPRMSSLC